MEFRRLGASGFSVPALSFGTATFAGRGEFFQAWGATEVSEARRLIAICLDAGLNMFDSADVYSMGGAEEVLGQAIRDRPRDGIIISTKATFRAGDAPNQVGSSRFHLIATVEKQLKRLGTDYIDLFQLHGFDALTPVEEVLSTLDTLVRAGKIRYTGVSNFSGWHLMKSLAAADRHGFPRYVANQTYYSLVGRDYEWELMPLGLDQGVGLMVWSPLGWGRLTGKIRRGQPAQAGRIASGGDIGGPPVESSAPVPDSNAPFLASPSASKLRSMSSQPETSASTPEPSATTGSQSDYESSESEGSLCTTPVSPYPTTPFPETNPSFVSTASAREGVRHLSDVAPQDFSTFSFSSASPAPIPPASDHTSYPCLPPIQTHFDGFDFSQQQQQQPSPLSCSPPGSEHLYSSPGPLDVGFPYAELYDPFGTGAPGTPCDAQHIIYSPLPHPAARVQPQLAQFEYAYDYARELPAFAHPSPHGEFAFSSAQQASYDGELAAPAFVPAYAM